MPISLLRTLFAAGSLMLAAALGAPAAEAASNVVGPDTCKDCHTSEHGVWAKSPHAESFKTIHKNKAAKDIVEAVGGKDMRREDTCITCHFTVVEERGRARPVEGPSCESCHGAAAGWVETHNDYGGKGVKKEQETAAHKEQRIASATSAGMVWPFMLYDAAENCNACHGMANDAVDGATISKMIDAGHPINGDFEFVAYSQGPSVKHRFYPPDTTVNKDASPAELSRLFLAGQAAALVAGTAATAKVDNAKFDAAWATRLADAKKALGAVKGKVPAANALLSSPTAGNARAFTEALANKDFSGEVGSMLPKKFK